MANDGQIVFEVTADGKHAIADIKEITRAIQQETGKWDAAAGQAADGIEGKFSGMLKKLAAGFSAAKIGKALLDFGKDALQAASDLREVQNVVDTTFGENANQIESWAKSASAQFGLTETQAKKFSSTMGAMLKSSGLAGDQIVSVSTDLAGLAADMASFYNLDFEEAFSKIRSGMSGMTMPLKELGIDMSVDTMNAFALAQGLEKTFSQMDQSEQTMLRYQYLMQATADAQGDFARTSDEYANSRRKLESNVEAIKAALGESFIGVLTQATGYVNEFIQSFMPDESKKTVLDRFNEIDVDTEGKIRKIREVAGEAEILIANLDKIGGEKARTAGSAVQQIATDLGSINLDSGKAGAVNELVTSLAQNIPVLASLQGTSNEEAVAWLNGISEAANGLEPDNVAGWESLIAMIKEGLPGFENTDVGASFFAALGSGVTDVEKQTSVYEWVLSSLGDKTEKTAQEQEMWLRTCKQLVQTIPGLSSIINTETGEVKGGTDAIRQYVDAWEKGQTKLAYLKAHQSKGDALEQEFSDLFGLKLNADLAGARLVKRFEKVKAIYDKYGQKLALDKKGQVSLDWISGVYGGVTEEERKQLEEFKKEIKDSKLGEAYLESLDIYNTRQEAYDLAKEIYAEDEAAIEGMAGNTEEAAKAMTLLERAAQGEADALTDVQTAVKNANDALKEMADYAGQVRENVRSSIESTVKGFDKIESPMMQARAKTKDLTDELTKLGSRTKKNADKWDELNKQINKYNSESISAQGMRENLKQQAQWMDDYLKYLNQARANGVSADLLAQLSDGSTESYDYLEALANAAPSEVEEINAAFARVSEGKKNLEDELTAQNLSVDQTFMTLQQKAQEAIAALDLGEEAKENIGETIKGIAAGIGENAGAVEEQVNGIIAQLERLNGFTVDLDFGGFGHIVFKTTAGKAENSGRFGINYVPRDDYLIRAHEGERLLTAQENQIWNTLLNGGYSGFDLDSLGGVMRDNIKPGGNVYLDGRAVGNVISDQQGKSYRSLQRSGWQV